VEVLESADGIHFQRTGTRIGGGIFSTFFSIRTTIRLDATSSSTRNSPRPSIPARHGVYAGLG